MVARFVRVNSVQVVDAPVSSYYPACHVNCFFRAVQGSSSKNISGRCWVEVTVVTVVIFRGQVTWVDMRGGIGLRGKRGSNSLDTSQAYQTGSRCPRQPCDPKEVRDASRGAWDISGWSYLESVVKSWLSRFKVCSQVLFVPIQE